MSQILSVKTKVARRGHVYKCMRCTTITPYQSERSRVVSHLYKDHVPLVNSPFYCKVCLFRSVDETSLRRHVTSYGPHRQKMSELASLGRPTTDVSALLRSNDPYVVREGVDLVRLDTSTSEDIWTNRARPATAIPPCGIPILDLADEDVLTDILGSYDPQESVSPVNFPIVRTPVRPVLLNTVYTPSVPEYVPSTIIHSGLDCDVRPFLRPSPAAQPTSLSTSTVSLPVLPVPLPVYSAPVNVAPVVSATDPTSSTESPTTNGDGALVLAIREMTDRVVGAMKEQTTAYNLLRATMTGFIRRTEDLVQRRDSEGARGPSPKRSRLSSPKKPSVKSKVVRPK